MSPGMLKILALWATSAVLGRMTYILCCVRPRNPLARELSALISAVLAFFLTFFGIGLLFPMHNDTTHGLGALQLAVLIVPVAIIVAAASGAGIGQRKR